MRENKIKYKLGDHVWLKHTQEEAVVVDFVDMFMLKVRVNDLEVPVYKEDVDLYQKQDQKVIEAEAKEIWSDEELYFQKYGKEVQSGFYLSFVPVSSKEGADYFDMMLVNDTNDDIRFEVKLYLMGELYMHLKNPLARRYIYQLGDIAFDELNENPEIEIILEHRSHPLLQLFKRIKIRPKSFFKDLSSTPVLESTAYNYKLGFLSEIPSRPDQEIIITPALKKQLQRKLAENKMVQPQQKHAYFFVPDVIDLHIECLVDNPKGMSNAEMIKVQLNHFKHTLDDAIAHHREKLTVIHGIGKGKLRQEIWEILRHTPAVRSYNNEYHPNYGFGATFVYLR